MGMMGQKRNWRLSNQIAQWLDQLFTAEHRHERVQQRDAELNGWQIAVRIGGQFHRQLRTAAPFVGHLLQPALARAIMAISEATKKPLAMVSTRMSRSGPSTEGLRAA